MKTILINNRFVKENEAKISIFSDAFQRGHGVFETLRTYKNKKFFMLDKHISRLQKSTKAVGIKLKYNSKDLIKQVEKVSQKSPHENQRIKIIVTNEKCIITSTKIKTNKDKEDGVKVMSINCMRSLPEVKSISYLSSYLSHEIAAKNGCYDAVLVDGNQEVYEGAYSNIFWVKNGRVFTREKEVLEGITRQWIIENSPKKVQFKKIKLEELQKADEVFLTQSVSGITPVTQINDKRVGDGKPGKYTIELATTLKKTIETI